VLWLTAGTALAAAAEPQVEGAPDAAQLKARLITEASDLLDQALVSYVYGGYQVGDSDDCAQCNVCLSAKNPAPSRRLAECPMCARCSLDCTHFIARVYDLAGAHYPYIDTKTMLGLSARELKARYGLIDLGTDIAGADVGDILVYDGHAVLLERRHPPVEGAAKYRGDVVHATGGGAIQRPGEGLQRERFVDLLHFRGLALRRILRHGILAGIDPAVLPKASAAPAPAPKPAPAKAETPAAGQMKLRRVVKRSPKPD
jgi:hypothetical protein